MMERRVSIAEPVSQLRRIGIRENGEPLVDFLTACPGIKLDRARFVYRRETLVRRSVSEKLSLANERLMRRGFRIHIIEGWRAPLIQKRMYSAVYERFQMKFPNKSELALRRLVNQFTAPMDRRVPPPHTTGGAIDIGLFDLEGNPHDMTSPYDPYDHHGFPTESPLLSPVARRNRELLSAAFEGTNLTNYPSEYWHWSYGDQGWAYRGGHPHAIFAATEPIGWIPEPTDLGEHPLLWID